MSSGRTLSDLSLRPVSVLESVSERKAGRLAELGVESVLDLLTTYPRRYIDRTRQADISGLQEGDEAAVLATVQSAHARRARTGRAVVDVVVRNDTGRLNSPFLGELVVQGLTVAELEQLITRGLKDSYLRDPAVTVSIAEYRPFFLYGEVQKPGGIPYQPRLTVERAIALGGGFTERASRSKIEVVRASDPKHKAVRVELSDPVFPGDVITVKQSFF